MKIQTKMYSPVEDSFFLSEILEKELKKCKKNKGEIGELNFLDVGCGSCIQSETALKSGIKKSNIICLDIDKEVIKNAKKLGFKAINSDLFEKLKKTRFNFVAFNPPYLPEHKYDKKADTSGGKLGDETILKFLKQAKSHLKRDGKIFLLFSSFTPKGRIIKEIKKQKLRITKEYEKPLFMEKLHIYILE